ncbi:MAG: signal peptide peptidase SppA [Bacteroidota bacterium]
MSQFIKSVTAATIGVFIALIVFFLFIMLIMGSLADSKPVVSNNTVLELDLSSFIPEKTGNVGSSGFDFENTGAIGLNTITQLIDHAANDTKIKGILLNSSSVGGGQATVSSIRESLLKFKEKDKFIYAYSDYYSQSAYYLASVADSVFLNPLGMIDIKGYSTLIPFYKSAMDKIGISMNVFYAGNFKSATEPYRRYEISEENRLQTQEFLNGMVNYYKDAVAESRGLTADQVDMIMTEYKGRTAKSSLSAGLVDKLAYWDEVKRSISNKLELTDNKKIRFKGLKEYHQAVDLRYGKSASEDKIAVVYAEGTINYGDNSKGQISEDKYLGIFDKLERDNKVKAVVLRVNSPGGNSLTSDIIWRGIERLKAAGKPVIASFGDYAASGGYYIAAGADSIVSAANTLTGSIGVYIMFPNASNMLNEKIGINFDEVKTHPMAVGLTPYKDLSDAEKQILQDGTIETYDIFLQRVADGRGMTVEEVHEVAQGRVWTGEKAKELGLVDEIGGIEDAIRIAAASANIDSYKIKSFPEIKQTFWDQVIESIVSTEDFNAKLGVDKTDLKLLKEYKEIKSILLDRTPQVRLPFIFNID